MKNLERLMLNGLLIVRMLQLYAHTLYTIIRIFV
jgi:hypothetical protein